MREQVITVMQLEKPLKHWQAGRYVFKELHQPSLQQPQAPPVLIVMQEPKLCTNT